jgi:ribosome-binding protein aMBF1 (putative translation factor)
MTDRSGWAEVRARWITEPGANEAYQVARLAYELGQTVRQMRKKRGLSQRELAQAANMTQSAVARFEAGGAVPTLPVLGLLGRTPRS